MIVYEREHDFVMVKQYDHSMLAGELAKQLNMEWLENTQHIEDFQLAVKEHDKGWVNLDEVPLWNDLRKKPFGVEDLPLLMRLPFYLQGLSDVRESSEYAALLVSMHYTTFRHDLTNIVGGFHERAVSVVEQLMRDQINIRRRMDVLEGEGADRLEHLFLLFQFLDELSLYLCMQDPGTQKDRAVFPRKDGFQLPRSFAEGTKLIPEWIDENNLILAPYPLKESATFTYRAKIILKTRIHEVGLASAYAEAIETARTFTIHSAG